jgi:hypothetical protein
MNVLRLEFLFLAISINRYFSPKTDNKTTEHYCNSSEANLKLSLVSCCYFRGFSNFPFNIALMTFAMRTHINVLKLRGLLFWPSSM